jgi:hypothetical protein
VPPARRRWYQAPGTLAGAATFSAVFAWLTVAVITVGRLLQHLRLHSLDLILFIVLAVVVRVLLFAVGIAVFWLAVAGAIATVPRAIAWLRAGDRTGTAIAVLSNAVASWVVLGYLMVHLGLYRSVF